MNLPTARFLLSALVIFVAAQSIDASDEHLLGFEFLIHGDYGSPSLSDDVFNNLWLVWDGEFAHKASTADDSNRRKLTFMRYGLHEAPYKNDGLPMGYTRDDDGTWRSNCLLCHGGSINGVQLVGAPNNRLDLQTLNEDIRALQRLLGNDSDNFPLHMNTSVGLTNAVVFSNELLRFRNTHLDINPVQLDLGPLIHHDLDAPALWNVKHKRFLYSDAFVAKSARALMQFAMTPDNDGDSLRAMLPDFERVLKYLETLTPPPYPGAINSSTAQRGQKIFETQCAVCHGTYGENRTYPNRLIPKEIVKTDSVRLAALTPEFRSYYALSWLSDYGAIPVRLEGTGYVAPPLNGIWASAPYFHNGSVPTLYGVLTPSERPSLWKVVNYDITNEQFGGLVYEEAAALPLVLDRSSLRQYYDTTQPGKSNAGHDFGSNLSDSDKLEVIEYLKTL